MVRDTEGADPYDDMPIVGEVSDISGTSLKEQLVGRARDLIDIGHKLLPSSHELISKTAKDDEEMLVEDLVGEDQKGLGTKIVEGVKDHKTEVAIAALSVTSLSYVLAHYHARHKK